MNDKKTTNLWTGHAPSLKVGMFDETSGSEHRAWASVNAIFQVCPFLPVLHQCGRLALVLHRSIDSMHLFLARPIQVTETIRKSLAAGRLDLLLDPAADQGTLCIECWLNPSSIIESDLLVMAVMYSAILLLITHRMSYL